MSNQPRLFNMLAVRSYRRPSLALASILSAILIPFVSGTVPAQQSRRLVEEVEVAGYRRLTREDILRQVKTRAGEPYSEELIQRDLQSVLQLGWFDRTRSRVTQENGRCGGVIIIFEVVELPLILDVKFEGLGDVKESELIEAFRQQDIKVANGLVYEPVEIRKAMRTVKNVFALRGWPDYLVTVRLERSSASYTSITFEIERQARF
jgi:outer membrane protein assembly factor BamA